MQSPSSSPRRVTSADLQAHESVPRLQLPSRAVSSPAPPTGGGRAASASSRHSNHNSNYSIPNRPHSAAALQLSSPLSPSLTPRPPPASAASSAPASARMAGDPPAMGSGGLAHPSRDTHQSLLGHSRRAWLHNKYLERVPIATLASRGGQIVALYFSASWSLPCRAFTPLLARVHAELQEQRAHRPFEVVHIGFEHAPHSHDKQGRRRPQQRSATTQNTQGDQGSDNGSGTPVVFDSALAPPAYMNFGLRLPSEDRHTRRRLVQRFGLTTIPAVVFLTPSGEVACTHGVALLHSRGAQGYPFSAPSSSIGAGNGGAGGGVLESGERRRFEQEVVLLFAHVDRRQRLLIDAHDLEVALAAGGQLPLAAIRPYAAQVLHDIASPSFAVSEMSGSAATGPASIAATATSTGSSSFDSSVAAVRARFASRVSGGAGAIGGLSVSLAEWKAFFARAAALHGAEFPLEGLRRMLGAKDAAVYAVDKAPEATFEAIRAEFNEQRQQQQQHAQLSTSSTSNGIAAESFPRLSSLVTPQPHSARSPSFQSHSSPPKQLRFSRAPVGSTPLIRGSSSITRSPGGAGLLAVAPLSAR